MLDQRHTLALVALSFIAGLSIGNAHQIERYFTYSCKGYRFLDHPDDYQKQALIAVYQEHPRTDLKILTSETIPPSAPNMFAPSMLIEVGINEKSVLIDDNGHQNLSRSIVKVIKVHVDGCGGISFP